MIEVVVKVEHKYVSHVFFDGNKYALKFKLNSSPDYIADRQLMLDKGWIEAINQIDRIIRKQKLKKLLDK